MGSRKFKKIKKPLSKPAAKPAVAAAAKPATYAARGKRVVKDAQQAMLFALLEHFGGTTEVMKILRKKLKDPDITRQVYFNWAKRGNVPLEKVADVASALGVSPYVLSYKKVSQFHGTNPSWQTVVAGVKIDKKLRDRVLQFPAPK